MAIKLIDYLVYLFQRMFKLFSFQFVTLEYPNVKKPIQPLSRISLQNKFDDCTGCLKCAEGCPVNAIKVKYFDYPNPGAAPKTTTGVPFERGLEEFFIDYSRCTLCGHCINLCPTKSLSTGKKELTFTHYVQQLNINLMKGNK